ncbi:MAG: TIGR04551 family protein [Myxococcales bacterium]|nr:TIGR04551 family protein [Myxococcales bacterium]
MSRALLVAATVLATTPSPALAQTDGGTAAPAPKAAPPPASKVGADTGSTAGQAEPSAGVTSNDPEAMRREFDAKLEAARREMKELREEMRAQAATQSVAQGWQEDWVDEKRKLELVTLDGYLRVRPDLFYRLDLGRAADPAGYQLWGRSPISNAERTNAGVNMRLRVEPTLNISEEVRIHTQIDALDNLVWGSTPDYAFSRNAGNGYWYDRNEFSLFSFSEAPQRSGINSLQDSISVKRVWGEVSTPIGILRLGRMGSHWGLGMQYNDGNGLDNDWGDTVDRVSFTAEPIAGFYITPMLDWNVEGPSSVRLPEGGQPYDTSNSDEVHSYIIAIARRDTESERVAKLDANHTVFNYGVHFTYRVQRNDPIDYYSQPWPGNDGVGVAQSSQIWVQRNALLFIPDLWAKVERKNFRIEAEFAAILGSIQNRALTGGTANSPGLNQSLYVYQFGGVLQGEYRFLNGDLEVGGEVGFASGDDAPGFGNYPRRRGSGADGATGPGDIDGPQYRCSSLGGCTDDTIKNYRFNRDYRVDMILYREILGSVTDSLYVKPKAKYRITQGFDVFASLIWSRAIFVGSTPGGAAGQDANLGVEINAGARYETEDGFFAQLQYGILFPLGGFAQRDALNQAVTLDNAQALRGLFGIRF